MTRYDWLYLASAPAVLPFLAYKALKRGKYRQSAPAMIGRGPQWSDFKPWDRPTVWMHAVSAGEVVAAKAVAPELKRAYPDCPLVASTITETGQNAARRMLDEAEEVFYFPLDLSPISRKFMRRYRPKIVTLFEAELWPNFLLESDKAGAKVFLLNGRLSERSFSRYRRFRGLMAGPIQRIQAFCMQTEEDAARMREIVGPEKQIFVTGNCKFDIEFQTLSAEQRREMRERLGIAEGRAVIVAGSTHPGEEEFVLAAWEQARQAGAEPTLILAPRHPERFDAAADLLRRREIRFHRSSGGQRVDDPQVVLLDTMGELAKAYGLGDLGIVGGSFVPIGGHNLLEAAAHSIPVVYGPHMRRQPDMLRLMGADHGGFQTAPEDLGAVVRDLLGDEERRREAGRLARKSLDDNRGSARRMVEIIREFA